jgi:hypothetical protein
MNQVQTKSIFSSSTFYFGLAQIAFGALGLFIGKLDQVTALSLFTTGLGTIGFRFKTDTPVSIAGGIQNRG